MSDKTGIQWTDATWNPIRGCSRVSEGCRHCYAEGIAARFSGPGKPYEGLARFVDTPEGREARWTGEVRMVPGALDQPLHWRRPRRIFVNSMSDLFHEGLPDETIEAIFGIMAACPAHTFQVLTKRPARAAKFMERVVEMDAPTICENACQALEEAGIETGCGSAFDPVEWPLPNVWMGTSVETQATADERIPLLLATPAAVRFVSYEPALGPVDFEHDTEIGVMSWLRRYELGSEVAERIDWLIAGGESGHHARPCDVAWLRSARDQCAAAGVPFFCKQLGSWQRETSYPGDFGRSLPTPRDRHGSDPDEWPEDLRVRQFPESRAGG